MKALEVVLRTKIYALSGLFSLVVLVLMISLYQHQVIKREKYLAWSERQQLQPIRLIPLRGKILDRRGTPMAVSLEAGSLFAHPAAVEDPPRTARFLASQLEIDAEELYVRLIQPISFVWLARQLPLSKAKQIQELGLSGVGMEREGKRYYPNRDLAANVIGFVGVDSQGLEGLEWHYDECLRGSKGSLLLQRDARGRLLWQEVSRGPNAGRGRETVLTLDVRIQFAAERALRKAVKDTQASSGSAVVLDPRTGEVLAMACIPSFNPNCFQAYPRSSWRNRCITDTFEPGSTAKAFLLAAALEERVISEDTKIDCEGGVYLYGGHWIHDLESHEELTVLEIITNSSNIGATKIAERLEAGKWWKYLHAFGFGQKTGIDLPGEVPGVLRPWTSWAKVALGTHAFGQGFSVTTLQLASAFAVLANGGFVIEPFVVRETRDETGRSVEVKQSKVFRRVISKATAERVLAVLEAVVDEGTGRRAKVPGYRVAGKTGTAQRYDQESSQYSDEGPVVSFVGIVPADRPEMVIAVVLNEPTGKASGGTVAAPVFREIAASSLHYRSVPGQVPTIEETGYPVPHRSAQSKDRGDRSVRAGIDVADSQGSWRMPDLRSLPLRSALRALEGLPVLIRLEGSGRIIRQDPEPGALLRAGQALRLVGSADGQKEVG